MVKFEKKKEAGIALVTLIITIIALIILATLIIVLLVVHNKNLVGGKGTNPAGLSSSTKTVQMAEALKKAKFDKNTKVADKYGNVFTVPKGFKIATPNSDATIEYDDPNSPTVQDGIVIEDAESGNQFVWIPVGKDIKIASDDGAGTKTVEIALERRIFNSAVDGVCTVKEHTADGSAIGTYYIEQTKADQEKENQNYGNAIAKEIDIFKEGVKNNGGYYLARYEASYGSRGQVASKKSTGTLRTSSSVELTEGMLWNYVTQAEASNASQAMYNDESNKLGYQSDLVNSYAWDTAIYYIQECSEDGDYAMQKTINSSKANTGINNDRRCNICDMAENVCEWSTETYTFSIAHCVSRGGYYNYSILYTSYRGMHFTNYSSDSVGFRPILYVK